MMWAKVAMVTGEWPSMAKTFGKAEVSDSLRSRNNDRAPMAQVNHVLTLHQPHLKIRVSPSGIHLFNRATGLNVLLDEVRVPPSWWARAPRQVSIALTNACDLACNYCFAPKDPAVQDFERVANWLDELDANGCLGVGFGGGEPTLYPRLAELCHYATRHTGLAVTVTTHAHHLDDEFVTALAGCVHFIRVSMDGVGATYEALRGRSFAAFRCRLENVRSLAPFGINYVVNSRTLPDLDAATMLAAQVGAVEFLLLPELPVGGNGGIDNHTTKALRRWVTRYGGSIPLTVSEAGADGLPFCNPLVGERDLHAYAYVDASGILKRFSYDRNGVAIGADGIIQALNMLRTRHKEAKP